MSTEAEHWSRVQLLREIVTLRKQVADLEARLHEGGGSRGEERFRLLFEHAYDAFILEDAGERIIDANRRATVLTGYARDELLGMSMAELESDDFTGPPPHEAYLNSGSNEDAAFESRLIHKGGRLIPVEVHIASLRVEDEVLYLSVIRDISERLEYQEQLHHLARHDPLTGSFNRFSLDELLAREVARSERYGRSIAFLMIDVDRFKEINDGSGHAAGDQVLCEVADLLRVAVRATDLVVRYGGDEFLVVLPETPNDARPLRERILAAVDGWNNTQTLTRFPVTLSIGAATWKAGSGEDVDDAITRADEAMYEDKRARRVARE